MASINKVEVGQTLYKTYKEKMGRTTMSTTRVSEITITEVNVEEGFIRYKSRFSYTSKMSANTLKLWRVSKPVLISSFTGSQRLATKAEIKKMREEGKIK